MTGKLSGFLRLRFVRWGHRNDGCSSEPCRRRCAPQGGHFDEEFEPTVTAAVVGGEPPIVHAIAGFRASGGVA